MRNYVDHKRSDELVNLLNTCSTRLRVSGVRAVCVGEDRRTAGCLLIEPYHTAICMGHACTGEGQETADKVGD